MKFRVLGPLAVVDEDGDEIAIGSPTQRVLLASLLAAGGKIVSSESLIDVIWEDDPPRSAESSLRTYVSRLRNVVGDRLERRGRGYAIVLTDDDMFDAALFDGLRESADVEDLDAALRLWRGDAYGDLRDLPTVVAEARRLEELHASAEERQVRLTLTDGDASAAVAAAEALVVTYPLREGAWTLLVQALTADERTAEALRAYQRAADELAEAGLEPSDRLREAEREAVTGVVAERSVTSVDAPPVDESLIGRDEDRERVHELLDDARVVTVHGAGGVGKTRLAHAIAAERVDRHRHGVHIVQLARVHDGEAALSAIVDALDLVDDTGLITDALARAGRLEALLVLDNCEHVLDAVAEAVETMVGTGSSLTVLATSRERLGVRGEYSWALAPLSVDDVDGPAVRLFIQRATEHVPALEVGPEDRVTIRRLCAHLDGMPLAIEMAAARVGALGLRELADVLGHRLDILRSGRRLDDPRHRTLTDVIAWSEDLLSEEDRAVFHDLGVFSGPVTAEIAALVLDRPDVLDTLCDLVDRSLLVADTEGDRTLYRSLRTVRRHSQQRLEEQGRWSTLRRRQLAAMVELAGELDLALRSEEEAQADAALDSILAELRAAHAWARDDDPAAAIALSARLHVYGVSRTRDEVQRWAEHLGDLVLPGPDGATTLATIGFRANNQGRFDIAVEAATRSLELAGTGAAARFAHEVLGDAALYNGDLDGGHRHAERAAGLGEVADDQRAIALGRGGMALSRAYAGRFEEALKIIDATDTRSMSPSGRAWMAYCLGEVLGDRNPGDALDAVSSAVTAADAAGERFLAGVARISWSSLLGRHGPVDKALGSFADIIDYWLVRRNRTHLVTALRNLVVLLGRAERHEAAARLLGALDVVGGADTFGEEARLLDAAADAARLGTARFDEIRAEGAAHDLDTAAAFAQADIRLALEG